MKRHEGKVAIVTGAGCVGPGLGNCRPIAVRLAEEGDRVLAADEARFITGTEVVVQGGMTIRCH